MRLFIAIDVPLKIKESLLKICEMLPKDLDIKMNKVKEFHLTLKFLGEVPEEKLPLIKEKLTEISCKNINLKLEKVGFFKNRGGYINVIWAGCSENKNLSILQKNIETKMEEIGFAPENRKFSPHLTLARIKYYSDNKGFEDKVCSINIDPQTFDVKSFSLIESILTREGAKYKKLL